MSKDDSELAIVAAAAQTYLSEVPTIVLGSGASVPLGLPTMKELGDVLLSEIVPVSTEDAAVWGQFKNSYETTGDLEKALDEVRLSDGLLADVIQRTWVLISERDQSAYTRALADPGVLGLVPALRHFLRVSNPRLTVITTNYDRLAEYAANLADAHVFTGFSPGWIQTPSNDWVSARRRVSIWKVHGSLDWFETPIGTTVGIPMQRSLPERHRPVIVTPGVSKYRQAHMEPFRTVMGHSDTALENARAILCVGYGFNDEHVQPKLIAKMQKYSIPIVVLARTLTPSAKALLLANRPSKYLLIEKAGDVSLAYCPMAPDGLEVPNLDLWDLSVFVRTLLEPTES